MTKFCLKVISMVFLVCFWVFSSVNTEGHKGVIRTLSAKTNGKLTLDVGLGINYTQDNEFIDSAFDENGTFQGSSSTRQMTNSLNISFGAATNFDIAAHMPFFYDKTGLDNSENSGGIGDLALSIKLLYPPPRKPRLFYQSIFFGGTIPTGSKESGIFPRYTTYNYGGDKTAPMKGAYYTNDCFTLKPMVAWTFDIGGVVEKFQFQIDVNVGGVFSLHKDHNNLVLVSMAMEYAPVDALTIFIDFAGQSRWQNFEGESFKLGSDPLMLSPGIKIKTPPGLYIVFSGDFALASRNKTELWNDSYAPLRNWTYSTAVAPKYGMQFALGWNGYLMPQDEDKDGVKDDNDRCPKDPEDLDHFEDEDGCPDKDNDNDGVLDIHDKCPNEPEDRDGFEESDGCPEVDNDKDGIPDSDDKCPKVAEDFDGIDDKDGCPDADNDKDGVEDVKDKCPNEPEDVDSFEDEDGCPDPDNDKDGIPDLKDKCPNKPETLNGIDDEDGCPDKKAAKKIERSDMPKHQILEGVSFSSGSSTMTYSSYPFLEPIIREMKKYPNIEIEIRGHTDSVGKYESNMRLSRKRAESVKAYLVRKGVESRRIHAVGFGPSSPVADNRTAAGRSKNRRIEIVRTR
jgi:outer membrane protein OmpA-like peptidoglycan-associated protein